MFLFCIPDEVVRVLHSSIVPSLYRLVHSDGSLFDLSGGGAPQLLLEEATRGEQRGKEERTDEKWMKEEEEEYPCMFDRESISDHLTGEPTSLSLSG